MKAAKTLDGDLLCRSDGISTNVVPLINEYELFPVVFVIAYRSRL
jgi:hypothetical protein